MHAHVLRSTRAMIIGALVLSLGACAGPAGQLPRPEHVAYRSAQPLQAPRGEASCQGAAPEKWAVVVGINFYQSEDIPDLKGAVNDAWAFYHYLSSPQGGGLTDDRLLLLLNEEATRPNVEGALGNFLAAACPQDELLVYFAGHGAPEPEHPENAFLLVHETQLDNLVGTAISMQRLYEFLRWRAQQAGRLLILIDACHSGNIAFPGERGVKDRKTVTLESEERSSALLQSLDTMIEQSKAQGWGAFSASSPAQYAQEGVSCEINGAPYPGGLFTCHLLKGLAGLADAPDPATGAPDGAITLQELFDYTRTAVLNDSRGQQIPQLSGSLDTLRVIQRPGASPVAIPQVPERYTTEHLDHPLRPWIYGGAGLTLLTLGAGGVLNLITNQKGDDLNREGSTLTRPQYEMLTDEHASLRSLTLYTYAAAGALTGVVLSLFLVDLLDNPQDRDDVYELAPWFLLSPSGLEGAQGGLDLKLRF